MRSLGTGAIPTPRHPRRRRKPTSKTAARRRHSRACALSTTSGRTLSAARLPTLGDWSTCSATSRSGPETVMALPWQWPQARWAPASSASVSGVVAMRGLPRAVFWRPLVAAELLHSLRPCSGFDSLGQRQRYAEPLSSAGQQRGPRGGRSVVERSRAGERAARSGEVRGRCLGSGRRGRRCALQCARQTRLTRPTRQ
jgi:hypothetical protein